VSDHERRQQIDRRGFTTFLKRGGRKPNVIQRCLRIVDGYQEWLLEQGGGQAIDDAGPQQLTAFVDWIERGPRASAKTHLWGLRYYFQFVGNQDMAAHAGALRGARIQRKPFVLAKFRGVKPEHAKALAEAGVRDVAQMRAVGATRAGREALAQRTGVPYEAILELTKLSDLARLGGVKAIRARLYHDAGSDTLEKLAAWEPEDLRKMLLKFVKETGFDGIAPLPKEAANAVATARRLPKTVMFDEGEA
jgi:hypothetical protein